MTRPISPFVILLCGIIVLSSCAPTGIRVSIRDKNASEVIMNVSKVKPNKKWPAFTMFVLEDMQEKEYSLRSDFEYKQIGECAHEATCYQFISPINNHGIGRKVPEFNVTIVNNDCAYPFSNNEQTVEFKGHSKKNGKGYDLMLGDDIGEPAPYEYSRGSFFLDKINPYPERVNFIFEFVDPSLKRAIQGAEVTVRFEDSKSENQKKIKEKYPEIKCYDEKVWKEFRKTAVLNKDGIIECGKSDEFIYPNLDKTYELEIIAKKPGLVPLKAKVLGKMKDGNTQHYLIYWTKNPNKRSIVDGYLFPDIMQR